MRHIAYHFTYRIIPSLVTLGSLEDILQFQRVDKLVIQAYIIGGRKRLGDGAGNTVLLLLAVHGEEREAR